ncbi:thioredoxin family protein [Sediminivirga luteola]|uniref:thioredoxin family protein n=1 Tax=Sediminivirga luteola TaxID=1774748 RepID=UPI001F56E1D8|nr:thioredoxin family protein [Sediminivirga luteola]MCI2266646.1 thioredoxin family protein [Sediminivirga luteola]
MRIEVLSIDDCPNSRIAIGEAEAALASLGLSEIHVIERRVTSHEEAMATAFAGSPTVLVDGVDVIPGTVPTGSLACRLYRTETGTTGYPSRAQIIAAIRAHSGTRESPVR